MLDRARRNVHEIGADHRQAPNRVALVYPGLGNQFAGMGRALSVLWPDVLDFQDAETGYLKQQLDPDIWWNDELPAHVCRSSRPNPRQRVVRRARD